MKRIASLLLLAATASLLPTAIYAQSGSRKSPVRKSSASMADQEGVAVVELFTSQGCSSCPPADDTLRDIASIADKNQLPVFVLSFHVDYWNRLGWTDPYSESQYSQRQRFYASAMDSNRVYTPQMIVNGTTEFVGSHRTKARQAISKSLKERSSATIRADLTRDPANHQIALDYKLGGDTDGRVLNVAVVQSPKANSVPRGENAGQRLSHVNVVRSFRTQKIQQSSGSVALDLPDDLEASSVQVIAYVQDPRTLQIVGATAVN